MSALDRLLDRTINRDEHAVKKKKREKRAKVASLKKLKQKAAPKPKKKTSEYSWSEKSDELVDLQHKVLQMKKEQQQQHSKRTASKKKKVQSASESKYAGFDAIGLTPGLAPVGYEESDSDDE